MKFRTKWFVAISVVLAGIAFGLSQKIWPPAPELPIPTSSELPFFVILAVIEALSFGFGISFLIFGWQQTKNIPENMRNRAKLGVVCLTWLIASWWPHGNWHAHIGFDMDKLLYIEYGFHVTLIIAAVILALLFFKNARELFSITQK